MEDGELEGQTVPDPPESRGHQVFLEKTFHVWLFVSEIYQSPCQVSSSFQWTLVFDNYNLNLEQKPSELPSRSFISFSFLSDIIRVSSGSGAVLLYSLLHTFRF